MNVVQVSNLCKQYDSFSLKNVSFGIQGDRRQSDRQNRGLCRLYGDLCVGHGAGIPSRKDKFQQDRSVTYRNGGCHVYGNSKYK
ncbi:MAG: hypothetical protein MJ101_00765 [Clostridia bacterium]|nr:hypothetical protein [Clostridia bacterium]